MIHFFFFKFVSVFENNDHPNIILKHWKNKFFESMGGKSHIRCQCNAFPLIPSNNKKKISCTAMLRLTSTPIMLIFNMYHHQIVIILNHMYVAIFIVVYEFVIDVIIFFECLYKNLNSRNKYKQIQYS